MSNSITASILKFYGPSLPNRDESNDAKQVIVGGVRRSRISSQCLKRAIRTSMGISDFRTAHLEDCVENILKQKVEVGQITEDNIDKLGSLVCKQLGCDWSKRASLKKDKEDSKKSNDKDSKGRTVIVVTNTEIMSVIDALIENDNDKTAEKVAKDALKKIRLSKDKAMFGIFVTSGVLENVDGAVQVSQTYSIDEYLPESDFIIASFSESKVDDADPFYGSFENFISAQKHDRGANAIADSWLYSNVMYSHTSVNLNELKSNLSKNVVGGAISTDGEIIDEIKYLVGEYIETFTVVEPAAKHNSMSTHSAPAILYVESIKDGSEQYTSFEKAIKNTAEKGIVEQGIEKVLEFATDQTFRTGELNRYVMIAKPYKQYETAFAENGVTVVNSLNDLKIIIGNEVERLV